MTNPDMPADIAAAIGVYANKIFDHALAGDPISRAVRNAKVETARAALDAAILARIAAAEVARDEALRERDEANATLRYCEQQWSDTDRVTLDKMLDERRRADAALARAERLEAALRNVTCSLQEDGEIHRGDDLHLDLIAALSPAPAE
jgi:hypothetical protein